jgi:hypothetical protein
MAEWKEKIHRRNKWQFSGIKTERTRFLHFYVPRTPVDNGQSISHSLAPGRIVTYTVYQQNVKSNINKLCWICGSYGGGCKE